MKITNIGDLYQLTFLPHFFPVNCYLVEEKNSLTLIDAALPHSSRGIIRAAQKIGKPITKIVLTHAHDDHVGALDSLKEQLPHALVYISKRDARLMEGDRSLDSHETNTPIKGGVSNKIQTRADVLLKEGDKIGSLEAISAPGHTPGSMAFHDPRTGVLIAGDAFQTRGGFAIAGQLVPLFPFPKWGTWDEKEAAITARKLYDINPVLLAVGHGKMLENPLPLIKKALEKSPFLTTDIKDKRSS
ncbi:MBL fold metallo-hydrolase [Bacillus sp. NEB1478]|uniref:MBL fold metallo-hydrolase n=1 Tax=Bacillus sp. NEB1478 TaxID=3073816 RepID=UPI0028731C48|nr:MBL fold metallo-hydrolase [Bacillus sp. NEB1478]WNB93780.1 MBL fold metallo-hydrolase [Bacillus sp. NEB1478]